MRTAHVRSRKVCKRGASSGTTFGEVSADRFVLLNQRNHGGRPSHDWIAAVTSRDPPFCVPGDSSGWAYDAEGCLMGSVVGEATGMATKWSKDGVDLTDGRTEA